MSLSERAKRDILVVRGQRTEHHREARDLDYGDVVDMVEKLVPRDSPDMAVEFVVMIRPHGGASVRGHAWVGDMVHCFEFGLPPFKLMNMPSAQLKDLVRMEMQRTIIKLGEAVMLERVEWKP